MKTRSQREDLKRRTPDRTLTRSAPKRGAESVTIPSALFGVLIGVAIFAVSGCRQDMSDQSRYEPLEKTAFFEDGRSARPPVEGTVARGQLRVDDHLYLGKVDGVVVDTFPFTVTSEILQRGRERYDIHCAACHDRVGNGRGMVVQRGFRQPSSLHTDRLREAKVGYFYDVITNGFGVMASYSDKLSSDDRWAIVAYIRALQLSQQAKIGDVPENEREKLLKPKP